ncbi:MAG: ATP-dependent Clp protease ATP-binding subunit ClpX [Candidatus Thiodiazotropha sp.]|nr:ATP-dependent Clp protease ATP-binding subunit ClpX [Candidatus Thiodiazotropha taylori]MBT3063883.1 ATP-dependent Clp protease ATP-binding subunit ClpX [Candidatus Thiodiazotropha sp. (ex Lucina pensylvanica)]PUB72703.1 MAG: ATP-dependent Clp protease ATP-binding subunit ClpX [gamma proteobacterium symbiont of Ctena orbiculata]
MTAKKTCCSFCSQEQTADLPLIAGIDGHICEDCVRLASRVVASWGRRRAATKPFKRMPKPIELKHKLDRYIVGQDLAKETLSVAVYNHYKRLNMESEGSAMTADEDQVEIEKSNILLLGPSGTGKTLLASTLARIVGVPFVIADATTLTQAGYVGEDVESILTRLLDSADGNMELAEWGIIYIDEIDKLARSGETSHGTRDVSGEGVQQALLKLVEGSKVKLGSKGRKDQGDDQTMNTQNILFIAGGAFEGLQAILEKRFNRGRAGIGFHVDPSHAGEDYDQLRLLEEVQPEDLRHFGLIPEFIGRFPVITALHDLDEAALVKILTEPKNALYRQYQKLFEFEGVTLEFTPEALTAVAKSAIQRGTGARGLRAVMEGLLRNVMFEMPSTDNAACCKVGDLHVYGEEPITLTTDSETPSAQISCKL